jgi:hypothetical protein
MIHVQNGLEQLLILIIYRYIGENEWEYVNNKTPPLLLEYPAELLQNVDTPRCLPGEEVKRVSVKLLL